MFSAGSSVHIWAIFHFVLRSNAFRPRSPFSHLGRPCHNHSRCCRLSFAVFLHISIMTGEVYTRCVAFGSVFGLVRLGSFQFRSANIEYVFISVFSTFFTFRSHFQYQYQRYTCHAYDAIIFCGY